MFKDDEDIYPFMIVPCIFIVLFHKGLHTEKNDLISLYKIPVRQELQYMIDGHNRSLLLSFLPAVL